MNKNDPDDARSVAVAALRSAGVREVRPGERPPAPTRREIEVTRA